ncbi:hypothetical protein CQA53_04485 [Helicobacter didelphidarum]|uniref:L,D-TPase catalytic domain-containing protein n=1 Tax=Helicobacter didelphidarum TaxID=2040648 RepID=A0A3D8IL49_9HELI|nr:L,D-transpeptidase family protein [Helicobacter didelphidarum]RDU66067.1 hypothetical protein CQA53_04485 [Helicobacter didelphidarum]
MRKILLMSSIGIITLCSILFMSLVYADKNRQYAIDNSLKNKITKIVVLKEKRKLQLYHNEEILKEYHIALGKNPIGHKQFEGDSKTPEGNYIIDSKNPKSRYFLNLGINYPNTKDREYAKQHGKSAGGDIKIHGLPNGMNIAAGLFQSYGDWTDGCIALDNRDVKEIYESVKIGTPIVILP